MAGAAEFSGVALAGVRAGAALRRRARAVARATLRDPQSEPIVLLQNENSVRYPPCGVIMCLLDTM